LAESTSRAAGWTAGQFCIQNQIFPRDEQAYCIHNAVQKWGEFSAIDFSADLSKMGQPSWGSTPIEALLKPLPQAYQRFETDPVKNKLHRCMSDIITSTS